MQFDPFPHMQSAVDIVSTSEHPANKIAATIAGTDNDGKPYALSRVNYWPQAIKEKIGIGIDIGGASGTVHAETACLLNAPKTGGAAMFVTDPPCPNCVKNMVEAGIRALYIDHKGFDKDFAARRGEDIRELSIRLCGKAGIAVYKIFRKEKRLETILKIPPGYAPDIERPARIQKIEGAINFPALIKSESEYFDRRNFALAVCRAPLTRRSFAATPSPHGGEGWGEGGETRERKESGDRKYIISAEIHPIAGFAAQDKLGEGSKYNHLLQPVHRVMMTAAREGLKIDRDYLYCSRVPTAREQVNMIGAGLDKITIGHADEARDEDALAALKILTEKGVLKILSSPP